MVSYGLLIPALIVQQSGYDWHCIKNSDLFAIYVDVLYLGSDRTNKQDLLVSVYTLPDEVFAQSPHVISSQILVLEDEFDVVCTALVRVYLVEH
jgi:hypothetical protein